MNLVVKNGPGFTFSGHSGDVEGGFSAANPLEFRADADKNIITNFTQGYHKVVVDVTPDRHGYAWGGGGIFMALKSLFRPRSWIQSTVVYSRTGASMESNRTLR